MPDREKAKELKKAILKEMDDVMNRLIAEKLGLSPDEDMGEDMSMEMEGMEMEAPMEPEMPEEPMEPEMPESEPMEMESEEVISEPMGMEDENPAFLDVLKKKGKKEDEEEEF